MECGHGSHTARSTDGLHAVHVDLRTYRSTEQVSAGASTCNRSQEQTAAATVTYGEEDHRIGVGGGEFVKQRRNCLTRAAPDRLEINHDLQEQQQQQQQPQLTTARTPQQARKSVCTGLPAAERGVPLVLGQISFTARSPPSAAP